jgi:hypothetical protein
MEKMICKIAVHKNSVVKALWVPLDADGLDICKGMLYECRVSIIRIDQYKQGSVERVMDHYCENQKDIHVKLAGFSELVDYVRATF